MKFAAYVLNVTPCSAIENRIPYEVATGTLIDRDFIKTIPPFATPAYVHVESDDRTKIALDTSREGRMVGIDPVNNTFLVLILSTGAIVNTSHVRFNITAAAPPVTTVSLDNMQVDDVTVPPVQVNVPPVQLPAVPVSTVDDTGPPATIDTPLLVLEDAAAHLSFKEAKSMCQILPQLLKNYDI